MNFLNWKKVYLVGIKGVGLTGLAKILKDLKIKVVGSDTSEKFFTDEVLKKEKIRYYEGFKEKNLKNELPVDAIISSVAYLLPSSENVEIKLAQRLNIPIYSYPQALSQIFNESFGIAICGSHGKSSTTAILGTILKKLNFDPTVLVGSEVIEWKSNSLISKNFRKKIEFLKNNEGRLEDLNWLRKNINKLPIFIIEADEYREAFLNYFPRVIILTNIDYDHPDYFSNYQSYKKAYEKFILNLKPPKILITYENIKTPPSIRYYKLKFNPKIKLPFPIPGKHFQKNLQLLYKFFKIFKISSKNFLRYLSLYKGIKRRFEIIKKTKKLVLIDDYAHHPNEIYSFYKSLQIKFPDYKKFLIFQPHTFTRTHFLFNEFLKIFQKIKKDKSVNLLIFKTFPSAREKEIILKIKKLKSDRDLVQKLNLPYFETEEEIIKFLKQKLKDKEKKLIASIGAGDVYKILEKIAKI